ncbi:MAG: class I SAM-dependent methyltransferase family protein [Candidatus Aenigmarchaeota archaeon]|nr:class I SAM-dependent methyltransferase family protein [Candidatus Aenigmarchaeota archaeon]
MSFKQKLSEKTGIDKKLLPSSYQIIGDVLLLKFMKIKSIKQKKRVASAIMKLLPYIKTVCEIIKVEKEFRVPKIRKLAGNGTETTHKEHGILYKLDVSKIMFSKGNLNERQRLITKIKPGEIIIDMFAGIGYFSLGLAKFSKAKKIYAIEKNPVAFNYLKENIKLNKIKNIEPILGDNREITEKLKEKADRIIMGYFPKTEQFLPFALMILKKKGIIHFHNTYKENELWQKPINEIKIACHGFTYKILEKKKVKSIAPRTWHVVLDIEIHK